MHRRHDPAILRIHNPVTALIRVSAGVVFQDRPQIGRAPDPLARLRPNLLVVRMTNALTAPLSWELTAWSQASKTARALLWAMVFVASL